MWGGLGRGFAEGEWLNRQIRHRKNKKEDHQKARALRNDASPFERKLWDALREVAAAQNLKFRRQQPIHPFIADFACMKARLIVELDGDSHDTRLKYDARRDTELRKRGFYVLRFQNEDIANSLEAVIDRIIAVAKQLIGEIGV